ncbi:5-(carboxyamino)imidazole ribonucleotide mutase [Candidatus Pantoea edessiphila]|uniref:N5-carboxyaminoimidazole ribonucleotide mutase n=1 Tax=Candidatus Pantoea edessiphila TaxID=2044610 RepID=A0A2P5SXI2_9GAMM|nr:5-(carboxyamino)imidazole ribonucleotide mutase [Candidatus Pantoea edessiphila]MBK4775866.1 5-(carboxyamino)imidazole ribonucleotide mutase [Pantoea sp. Edef]PPI87034.1 5-(carboxyamino)imidazole ribonucleotide mutase [Candidatus Pantoea edessiphila]
MNLVNIAIIMGSKSDWYIMKFAAEILQELDIPFHVEIISAHRTPDKLFVFAECSNENNYKVIIAGAGGAAHLPGMLAAKTIIPVLGVPIPTTYLNGVDSLYSILQMPSGIPVATLAIGKTGAINAALLATAILAINDNNLALRLTKWRKSQTNMVLNNPDPRKN